MIKYGIARKFVDYAAEENPFAKIENQAVTITPDGVSGDVVYYAVMKRAGWQIPIHGLKLYAVKTKHGGYREMYAPNKTFIRDYLKGCSPVVRILDTGEVS